MTDTSNPDNLPTDAVDLAHRLQMQCNELTVLCVRYRRALVEISRTSYWEGTRMRTIASDALGVDG